MRIIRLRNEKYTYPSLLALSAIACIIRIPIFSLGVAFLLWLLILIKAKVSFFSEVSFILLFSYLQGVLHKTIGVAGSTLAWAGIITPFYFDDLTTATLSFLIILLGFCWFTQIVAYEKNMYKYPIGIKPIAGLILASLAVLFIVAVFPSLPNMRFSSEGRARNESLPYGLVLFSLLLCALTFDLCKKHKFFLFVYAFVVFWVFGHGERVEILGFLSYAGIKYLNNTDLFELKKKVLRKRKRQVYIAGVLTIVVAMWIGMNRMGGGGISLKTLFLNILVQPTCGDIVYCFNCAADMWHTGNGLFGYTYIDYPLQLLPISLGDYSPPVMLIQQYGTMGGGLFFTESMMNFGMLGVIFFNFEFCLILYYVLKKNTEIRRWMWIPIVCEVFRICWYGRSVWIFAVFIEVPIVYLGTKILLNKVKF